MIVNINKVTESSVSTGEPKVVFLSKNHCIMRRIQASIMQTRIYGLLHGEALVTLISNI
jgi:hypothetical protein